MPELIAGRVKSVATSLALHAHHSQMVGRPFHLAKQAVVAAEPLIGHVAKVSAIKVHLARDRAVHDWKSFACVSAGGGVPVQRWSDCLCDDSESVELLADAGLGADEHVHNDVLPTKEPIVDNAGKGSRDGRIVCEGAVAEPAAAFQGSLSKLIGKVNANEAAVVRCLKMFGDDGLAATALQA